MQSPIVNDHPPSSRLPLAGADSGNHRTFYEAKNPQGSITQPPIVNDHPPPPQQPLAGTNHGIYSCLSSILGEGAESGNRDTFDDPVHGQAGTPHELNTQSREEMKIVIDKRLEVKILPEGATYHIQGETINTPVPADDYFRGSPMTVIEIPGGKKFPFGLHQAFRADTANIPMERLSTIAEIDPKTIYYALDPLPINWLLSKIESSPANDIRFQVFFLPPDSKWGELDISDKSYIQIPRHKPVVDTLLGPFSVPWKIVRSIEYPGVNIEWLQDYKRMCRQSYNRSKARRKKEDYTFIERCMKNMWKRVQEDKGPVRYIKPAFAGSRAVKRV